MHHHISADIEIDAPPTAVWAVLIDLDSYAAWNPYLVSSQGTVTVGERIENRMQPPGGKAMTFRPTVTVAETNRVFEWLGRLGFPGVFDGRHRFEIEATPTGSRLTQSEDFKGVLVRFMRKSLDTHTMQGFQAMNSALRLELRTSPRESSNDAGLEPGTAVRPRSHRAHQHGFAAWAMSSGAIRWVAVIGVPLAAAVAWGVFNVIDDPSRSGAAPSRLGREHARPVHLSLSETDKPERSTTGDCDHISRVYLKG